MVLLENYSIEDMDKMLCAVLGVRVVPPDIANLVHDFSGGSYFWVREIVNFLKEHGPETFMAAVGEVSPSDAAADAVNDIYGGASGGDDPGTPLSPAQRPFSPPVLNRGKSNGAMLARPGTATMQRSNSIMRPLARGQSFKTLNSHRNPPSHFQVKMNKLIMARFEGLHSDVQRILRTASIIGVIFSKDVLYGVLPTHLKPEMNTCMKVMLNTKWIYQDTEDSTLYQFVHPHAHQLIYELTPTSERKNLHRLVAEYIEQTSGDDKSQYALLSFHYQHYDHDRALRYAVQATPVLLESNSIFDFSDCVDLLLGSFECCTTSYDAEVLKKLVASASKAIKKFQPKQAAASNWWDRLKDLVRPVTAARRRVSFLGSSTAVAPTPTKRPVTAGRGRPSEAKYAAAGGGGDVEGSPGDAPNENGDDELDAAADELTYDMRLKKNFLDQLNRLRDKLDERLEQYNAEGTGGEPKDWQRSLLNLSGKHDRKFGRLRRHNTGNSSHNSQELLRFMYKDGAKEESVRSKRGVIEAARVAVGAIAGSG